MEKSVRSGSSDVASPDLLSQEAQAGRSLAAGVESVRRVLDSWLMALEQSEGGSKTPHWEQLQALGATLDELMLDYKSARTCAADSKPRAELKAAVAARTELKAAVARLTQRSRRA